MVRLIWLVGVRWGRKGSERPVDLLFRDLESVLWLYMITLMDAKIRNVGRGGRAISTTLFYGPGVIHQSALLAEADIDGKIITFCPFG